MVLPLSITSYQTSSWIFIGSGSPSVLPVKYRSIGGGRVLDQQPGGIEDVEGGADSALDVV
jgi:hypothetical protein